MKRLFLLAMVLVSGCAGVPELASQGGKTRSGVVEWRIGLDLAVLDLRVVTAGPDAIAMRVSENGREVLRLSLRDGQWRADGLIARGAWSGTWDTAPQEVSGWLTLGEALASASDVPDGDSEFRTGRMSVRFEKSGDELRVVEMACVATDDRFRVRF